MKTTVRYHLLAAATSALLCAAAQAADYPTTVLSHNPLAYWRLDESASSPAINKVANAGSLGSIADGYIVAGVGKGQPGRVGNAIRLSNPSLDAGVCNTKVDVTYNPGLNPAPPFSVEFWAEPNAIGADATGLCALSSFNPNWFGGGNRSGYLFYLSNVGVWQFRLGTTSGYAGICTATNGTASAGTWQHIVATYDGAVARLYINGTLANAVNANVANWTRNTQMAFRMGGTPLTGNASDGPLIAFSGISGNRGFDGWLDEVAVYSSVLSAATVKAHFDAATTNNAGYGAQILADTPVGYWNLDEPAVTTPDPASFPIVANSGSTGSAADGTNTWGSATAQAGSGYLGLGGGNNAAFFNGEGGHIELKDAPGLHISGNITLMAWVKPTTKDFFRNIIAHGWDSSYQETFLRISRAEGSGFGDGKNYYEIGVSDGSSYYDAADAQIPEGDIGHWVFLAGTYDGANWNLYRNGVLAASFPSPNAALDVTNRWSIGSRSDPSALEGLYFGGSIDEPAIFNTTLSAGDISAIYNAAQVPPVITRAVGASASILYKGSSAAFDVWAEGSPTLTYSWTSNGVPVGGSATNITLNNLAVGSLSVQVIVANAYGSATNTVNFSVVASKPLITLQPVALTRFIGRPFQFSVAALGSLPISYQWQTNGVDITGATSSTYSGTVSASTAGNYRCVLSNETGTSNSVTVALTALSIPGNYGGAVIADGPVAYWRLDESSGTVAHDYYGGHDGTYFAATLGQPGYSSIDSDTAAGFAGGSGSYVGNIDGNQINFTGHTNFTLEVWVNGQPGQAEEASIISKGIGGSGTTATEQFSIDVTAGHYRFFTRQGDANNTLIDANAVSGPDGTWQHVVGVYDDAGGTMYLYVNGNQEGTHATRTGGTIPGTTPVSIGSKRLGNDPAYNGGFNGLIDEVSIFPYALSAPQVLAHYGAAYGTSLPPTITKEPTSLTNYATLPAKFSVGAFGTIPLTYQWKKGGSPLSDVGSISGSTTPTLTINPLVLADAGNYSCTIVNVNGTTNTFTVSLTVLSAPTSPPSIPGLVLHLPFDNNLTDVTGRGNNGVSIHTTTNLSGGGTSNVVAATFAPGQLGQAFHFVTTAATNPAVGGTVGIDDYYATLGVRPDLQFGTNTSFSVAFWIMLTPNFDKGDLPFFTDTVGSLGGLGFVFATTYGYGLASPPTTPPPQRGGWGMTVFDNIGNGARLYGDIGSINEGTFFHHLAFVFDRTQAFVYLDGTNVHSTKIQGNGFVTSGTVDSGNSATIGQDPTGRYGEDGEGWIDDLGVWRRALTPLEVASIYIAGAQSSLSFTNSQTSLPSISIDHLTGTKVRVSWSAGTLQSATNVEGPYSNVDAKSPFTNSPAATTFYRTKL
jgi:Concanavalin A-like lectin/glucanases superfamily/Immunoglobulin domain